MKILLFLFLPITLSAQSIDSLKLENTELIYENRELNKRLAISKGLTNEFADLAKAYKDQLDSLEFVNKKMKNRESELLLEIEDLNRLNLELQQSLANNATDTNIVRMYQIEIETMKVIMKGWIIKTNEANQKSEALKRENEELKVKLENKE